MIVQGLWVGNKISKLEYISYSSFLNNGFEYWLYTYEDVAGLPQKVIQKDANEILDKKLIQFDKNGSIGGFSDLFRWTLMYKKGGVYVDSDVVCLKPFEIEANSVAGQLNNRNETGIVHASTQFLQFEKNSDIMKEAMEISMTKDLKNLKWADIGPLLIEKLIFKKHQEVKILPYYNFNPNHYWNWNFVLSNKKTEYMLELHNREDVFGIHLWNEMWRRNGINKETQFEKNSFMDIIEKKYIKG